MKVTFSITAQHSAMLCTALQCAELSSNWLHCPAMYCTALCCNVLYCTALQCTVLHYAAMYCTALQCGALHCAVLLSVPHLLALTHITFNWLLRRLEKMFWNVIRCLCSAVPVDGVVIDISLSRVSVFTKHSSGVIELVCGGSPSACVKTSAV